MNNKQKKVLCLALLLVSAPAALRAMDGEQPINVNVNVDIQVDPNLGQEVPADNPVQNPAPRWNALNRALARYNDLKQGTQDRWNGLRPRTRTATKVVAGAGILGAAGFLGHKLYKWWTKPVLKVENKSWEARFVDFNDNVIQGVRSYYTPGADDEALNAVLMNSLISEALETLNPRLLLDHDVFTGFLTPEQKAELEEICALAESEKAL